MPRLVILYTDWPEGRTIDVDMDIQVKDFQEATEKLQLDLNVTADAQFSKLVMKKWHDTHGKVFHQNANTNRGFKFIFI